MTSIEADQTLKRRALEIGAELAASKRAYLVDGIPGDQRQRAILEEEEAHIRLKRFDLQCEIKRAKLAAGDFKADSFLRLLIGKVNAAGLGHLVTAASLESMAAVQAADLTADYQSRTK